MANGDKPPGGVNVTIESPAGKKVIPISCHDADAANELADHLVSVVEGIKLVYEHKKG